MGRITRLLVCLVWIATSPGRGNAVAAHDPGPPKVAGAPADSLVTSLASARARVKEGQKLLGQAQFRAAADTLRGALRFFESHLLPGDPEVSRARVNLAVALSETGGYAEAVRLIRDALPVLDGTAPSDSSALGVALNTQGRLLTLTGNYPEARRVLVRALAIREQHHGPESPEALTTLNNLANVYSATHDLKSSRPIYERLVAFESASAHPDSARLGMYLNNLANAVSDLGDLERGRQLYERALAIRERVLGPNHPRLASTFVNMASLAEVMKDDPAALRYLQRAIDIYEATLGQSHPLTAEFYINRAVILRRLGQNSRAFQDALLGERLTREHLRLTARSLSASDAQRYEESRLSGLDVINDIAATAGASDTAMAAAALDAVIRSRAVLLDELAARNRALAASADSGLASLVRESTAAQERLVDLTLGGMRAAIANSAYRRSVEEARSEAKAAEDRLAQRSAGLLPGEDQDRVGLAAVAQALPPRCALVSYMHYASADTDSGGAPVSRYLAFVLDRIHRGPIAIRLGSANQIDSLVARWQRSGEVELGAVRGDEESTYRRIATELRARIWDPLVPSLAGARQIFVVPDGALNLVSLATLPSSRNSYLVETGPLIHYLSTERDLVASRARSQSPRTLLAMGGADFDHIETEPAVAAAAASSRPDPGSALRGAAPDCDAFRHVRFDHLEGSESECREVASLWRRHGASGNAKSTGRSARGSSERVQVLTGPAASEQAFKRLAPGYGALHLATHGFFVDPQCVARGDSGEVEEAVQTHPLLLSGLVLAGANQRSGDATVEDGLLTAEEIASLDLRSADWVALSACGTGAGTIVAKEGVFGLRRAFELAGAGTVIMSLWSVKDIDTSRWMRALYQARVARHLPAAEAVRRASLETLAELRAQGESTLPARWGAFVACGDWR